MTDIADIESSCSFHVECTDPLRWLVIGIGGCGCAVINEMITAGCGGVTEHSELTFIAVDSDTDTLKACKAEQKIFIPTALLNGNESELRDRLTSIPDADMAFVVSGMGGQAGTKLSPIVAEYTRQQEALTIGIATCPLPAEEERMAAAEEGLSVFRQHANSLIVVPLEKALPESTPEPCREAAHQSADKAIIMDITSITDTIIRKGLIGFGFADLELVLGGGGISRIGYGTATGKKRTQQAVDKAISNPLLGADKLKSALGVIAVIIGGDDLGINEVGEVAGIVASYCNDIKHLYFQGFYDGKDGELSVAIIACEERGAEAEAWYRDMETWNFDDDEFDTQDL